LATQSDYQLLRVDVGLAADDIVTLPDAQAQSNFDRAALVYTDPANPMGAQYAYTRVITIEQLYAKAVTQTDYTQNNSQEKASQLFDHYKALLDLWKGKMSDAIAGGGSGGGTAIFEVINRSYTRW
jgi:hypothetical protein